MITFKTGKLSDGNNSNAVSIPYHVETYDSQINIVLWKDTIVTVEHYDGRLLLKCRCKEDCDFLRVDEVLYDKNDVDSHLPQVEIDDD